MRKVERKDCRPIGEMFARAFRSDPVWAKVMSGVEESRVSAFFESPVRYGLRYGTVYTTSENLESAAVWVPSRYAEITMLRGIFSGSAISSMRVGMNLLKQFLPIFEPLEKFKNEYMSGREYIYLMILGVDPRYWRQGRARQLLGQLLKEADQKSLPIYLETATEKNIKMYESFGFKVVGEILHPIIDLPQWCMLREINHV